MALLSKLIGYTASASFLLLALLSPRSRTARYYLNTILYLSSMGVCSVLGIFLSVVLSLIPGQRLNINYYVARAFSRLAGTLNGIDFRVEGEENFAKNQPAVLVGNHQSSMDILYLGRIFPKRASIMAKKELRWAPLLGQWMWLSGAVFVNRASKKDAFKTFDYVGQRMRADKLSLWIFPEGTRSKLPVPDLLPFKMGAFHLALQAGVPIVPVVCENYYRFYNSRNRFESGTIRIKVLPAIHVDGYTKETVRELAEHVRGKMLEAIKQMDAEADRFDTQVLADAAAVSHADAAARRRDTSRASLGGVAHWLSHLVGVGKGHDAARDVARQREKLAKKGLASGGKAQDFGLVSEQKKGQQQGESQGAATATGAESYADIASTPAAPGTSTIVSRKTATTTGSGSSEEVDEEGNVLVKRPAEGSA